MINILADSTSDYLHDNYPKTNHLGLVQGQDAICQLTKLESKSSDSFADLFSIVINKPKGKKLSRK